MGTGNREATTEVWRWCRVRSIYQAAEGGVTVEVIKGYRYRRVMRGYSQIP